MRRPRIDPEMRFNTGDFRMSESHKATLKKANAAIVQGDFEGFLHFCTEDASGRSWVIER
jgi:hypothetical protein